MKKFMLNDDWRILQDVHDLGEKLQIYNPEWNPTDVFLHCISDWEKIDRLEYLQLLFAKNPYSGRDLRYFNTAPWWYKKVFEVPEDDKKMSGVLRFEGIDYFCKVWLNGKYLGSHEGYFAPFEFDVTEFIDYESSNTLIVKVWSPLDNNLITLEQKGFDTAPAFRFLTSEKNMIKGTYEHADGFIQRDINPIGIYGDVSVGFYKDVRFTGEPFISTMLEKSKESAKINIQLPLSSDSDNLGIVCKCSIVDEETGLKQAVINHEKALDKGDQQLELSLEIKNPKTWNCWDKGDANLYTAHIEIFADTKRITSMSRSFGIRKVQILRDDQQTTFLLNDMKVYIRGTNYFPEVYLSRMSRERYERDVRGMKAAGFNAIRVHVHVAKPEFYDVCDQLGMLVIQDSDITWFHPMTEEFLNRAKIVFGDMIRLLRNHPSIICWVCMNEPDLWKKAKERGQIFLEEDPPSMMSESPGPQLVEMLKELDPQRPYIKGSHFKDDPESGDEHDYTGSLRGEDTHYTDIYGNRYKFTTEFGFDAPASNENLANIKAVYDRIKTILEDPQGIESLHYYRYRYLKYVIEYHRITKYRPCSGYMQFLFSDVIPQSFYGIYDWWGTPKKYMNVFDESNQPTGIFMEYKENPIAIWAINDYPYSIGKCRAEWYVTDENGKEIISGQNEFMFDKDSLIKISDLVFDVNDNIIYQVVLIIKDKNDHIISRNVYKDPFHHPTHPKGHPLRIDQELGVRLYWA